MSGPSREEILREIAASIARLVAVPAASIEEDQRLIQDLKLDSLAIYELVVDLEERFGMQISNEDAERLTTVGEAAAYIADRLQEGSAGASGMR